MYIFSKFIKDELTVFIGNYRFYLRHCVHTYIAFILGHTDLPHIWGKIILLSRYWLH